MEIQEPQQDVVVNVDVDLTPVTDVIQPHLETIIQHQEKIVYDLEYQINLLYILVVFMVLAYIINFFYKLLNKF